MTGPFRITADECAVILTYVDARIGLTVDITPDAARRLAQELIDKATDCEDANEHELEQMS